MTFVDQPRQYEFRIWGRLSPTAQAAFLGMEVAEIPPQTVISGSVPDESALHGVLGLIQSLGLHVLSVRQIDARSEGDSLSTTDSPSAP